ncbi:MAG: AEC family transporter [Oscillospiraceae bacterium]|nr:AEC family transporter [Oscillospiraceae bacterium]
MLDILIKAGCYVGIIVLGMVLRRIGFFKEEDFSVLSKIVIKVTLPAAIISSSAGRQITPDMLAIVALGLGGGVLYIILGFLMNLGRSKEQQAFEMLNLPGYNIGNFALPFTQSFLGSVGVLTTTLFDVGNAVICLGGAYGVAASVKEGGGFDVRRVGRALSRSVPFLVCITVQCLNLLKIQLPTPILSFAGIISNANAFLAMLMIGVGFKLEGDRSQLGRVLRILAVRYGVAVVLALCYYFLLPFDLEIRQTLVILAFAPIGSAVPGFTEELKGDVGLSCTINSAAILCSIVIIVALLVVML